MREGGRVSLALGAKSGVDTSLLNKPSLERVMGIGRGENLPKILLRISLGRG